MMGISNVQSVQTLHHPHRLPAAKKLVGKTINAILKWRLSPVRTAKALEKQEQRQRQQQQQQQQQEQEQQHSRRALRLFKLKTNRLARHASAGNLAAVGKLMTKILENDGNDKDEGSDDDDDDDEDEDEDEDEDYEVYGVSLDEDDNTNDTDARDDPDDDGFTLVRLK